VPLRHADAYLPAKLQGFLDDGGLCYLLDDAAVTVVEWGDLIRKYLPENTLWMTIELAADAGRRVTAHTDAGDHFSWIAAAPKMSWCG